MVNGVAERYLVAVAALLAAGCGGDVPAVRDRAADDPAVSEESSTAAAERPVLLVIGTSLTAGFGVGPADAYPARLQELVDAAGLPYVVVNAGVSGETSAGALARIDWLLRQEPSVVVLETGANDGLRGIEPAALERNLRGIVGRIRDSVPGARVALVQMEAPPNLGRRYTDEFRDVYRRVAAETGAQLLPFPLGRVAGIDSLNQPDGIHPTERGHELMAETIWPSLEPLLREAL